jgi:hypothetical protein
VRQSAASERDLSRNRCEEPGTIHGQHGCLLVFAEQPRSSAWKMRGRRGTRVEVHSAYRIAETGGGCCELPWCYILGCTLKTTVNKLDGGRGWEGGRRTLEW